MAFVPPVVHVPVQPVSPRARRLAGELGEAIERFRREASGLTDEEVRQALELVRPSCAGAGTRRALAAVAAALAVAGGLGFFLLQRSTGGPPAPPVASIGVIGATVAIAAVVAGLALALRRR